MRRVKGQTAIRLSAYLAVVQDLVHGFGHEEDLSTIASDHKQEAISSLHHKQHHYTTLKRGESRMPLKGIRRAVVLFVTFTHFELTLSIKCFSSSSERKEGL